MAVTLRDKLARLPDDRRGKVEARAAELIAEEMTLRDLRLDGRVRRDEG